jgi:hypothetical protein
MSIISLARASTAALALAGAAPVGVASAAYLAAPERAAETSDAGHDSQQDADRGPPEGTHGAFVQRQLDQGLRGRDLAAAIHAEKDANNPGRGHSGDADHGHGHGHGAPTHPSPADRSTPGR